MTWYLRFTSGICLGLLLTAACIPDVTVDSKSSSAGVAGTGAASGGTDRAGSSGGSSGGATAMGAAAAAGNAVVAGGVSNSGNLGGASAVTPEQGGMPTSASPSSAGGTRASWPPLPNGGSGVVQASGSTGVVASNAGTTALGLGGSTSVGGQLSAGGGLSNTAVGSSTCLETLAPPTNGTATNGTDETKIALRWTAAACAETYEIHRSTARDGSYVLLGSTGLTVYDDLSNQDTIPYYYRLRSHSASQGYSGFSEPFTGSRKQGYVLETSWGSSGSGDGQFYSAYGVATDTSNNVYVLDTYNHRVQKFDAAGSLLTKWGGDTLSAEPGKFYYPHAIAVLADDVYVGDDLTSLQKFTSNGSYVNSFKPSNASSLLDLDLDTTGNLYVAYNSWGGSAQTLQIAKYDSAYALQTSFGGAGEGDGQFSRNISIAVDTPRSLVYVVDTGHSKVHMFTANGTYVTAWGSSGSGAMQFRDPTGIAVDADGNVYVADEGNDRVSKFSVNNGTAALVATWIAPACHALAIDANGHVVVLATDDAKVLVYRRR